MEGALKCPFCGFAAEPGPEVLGCPTCGVPLRYELPEVGAGRFEGRGLWRYRELLPPAEPVSLGEGGTPLLQSRAIGPELGIHLLFKLEQLNPTGSFKDRGASVLVSVLTGFGVRSVADDSSGNAASALAAYAARAGIRAVLFVPAYASGPKLRQIEAYGAELVRVPGPRHKATEAAIEACREGDLTYAPHNESPYFIEGLKTVAFEIFEELKGAPDHIVVPLGGGGLFLGIWKGFFELKLLGWVRRIPPISVVQSEACAPIVRAVEAGLEGPAEVEPGETVAEGVRIPNPPRGKEILSVLRGIGGSAVAVGDGQVIAAQRELAREEGLYVEPTSALAVAGLRRLVEGGHILKGDLVVLPLTGSGLKAGIPDRFEREATSC